VLEIREGAGGLEHLVHQRLVLRRLDLVEDRRQLLDSATISCAASSATCGSAASTTATGSPT
jgi:hypothetical protein